MIPRGFSGALVAALCIFSAACGRPATNIVIGSENTTEQTIVGEIVAQHLEKQLGIHVIRRPNIGGSLLAYQSLQSGEVNIYPEYTGTIVTEVLKEQPATDATQLFERAKGEMASIAQAQLVGPPRLREFLCRGDPATDPHAAPLIVPSPMPPKSLRAGNLATATSSTKSDAMPALTQYHLPMSMPMRSMDAAGLFKNMTDGKSEHDRHALHRRRTTFERAGKSCPMIANYSPSNSCACSRGKICCGSSPS